MLENQRKIILDMVDTRMEKKHIALKFGISLNSLTTIIRNCIRIQNYDLWNYCSKWLRISVYDDVDEVVLCGHTECKIKMPPIFGFFIIKKALKFVINGLKNWTMIAECHQISLIHNTIHTKKPHLLVIAVTNFFL